MRAANAREAQGHRVIHMEVGQPGTPAPRPVRDAAVAALANDRLGYAEALGLAALRARIARHYGDAYGVDLAPSRVVITSGSSGGFVLAFLACFDAGARIGLAMPSYPAYRNIMKALDLVPVPIPSDAAQGYQLTARALDAVAGAQRLDGVLVASPANPTGAMIPPEQVFAIADVARARGLRLISDEIYHRLTYGTVAETTLAAVDANAFVVNSFSKYYSMTGWRIGWLVVPENLVRPIERLAQNLFISVSTLSQLAAIHAFDATAELDANLAVYRANRALLQAELPKAGFSKLAPCDGAFYIYADVRDLTDDGEALCHRILHDADVAVTPGTDFDPVAGHAALRFSFAGPTDHMTEAVARLKRLDLAARGH